MHRHEPVSAVSFEPSSARGLEIQPCSGMTNLAAAAPFYFLRLDNASNTTHKEILPDSQPHLSGIEREGVAATWLEARTSRDEGSRTSM
jgi:hypothetical protein